MGLLKLFIGCAKVIRTFFAPRYHPERHYMRGPGPACARRDGDNRSAHA
ncbi:MULTISPECIES: hypothetical protein [Phyllobacteriaceae]|nr:hypothetical protein [Chelativorans sp. M5D2P16]MDZ5697244.1 hypothetical protein [Chelativorans sp. M5D2P16]